MKSEDLIPGMEFGNFYKLTRRETEILIPFLKKSYTTSELAKVLNVNKITLHNIIQRLKLKGLLILKDRDVKGTCLYEFNESKLNLEGLAVVLNLW